MSAHRHAIPSAGTDIYDEHERRSALNLAVAAYLGTVGWLNIVLTAGFAAGGLLPQPEFLGRTTGSGLWAVYPVTGGCMLLASIGLMYRTPRAWRIAMVGIGLNLIAHLVVETVFPVLAVLSMLSDLLLLGLLLKLRSDTSAPA